MDNENQAPNPGQMTEQKDADTLRGDHQSGDPLATGDKFPAAAGSTPDLPPTNAPSDAVRPDAAPPQKSEQQPGGMGVSDQSRTITPGQNDQSTTGEQQPKPQDIHPPQDATDAVVARPQVPQRRSPPGDGHFDRGGTFDSDAARQGATTRGLGPSEDPALAQPPNLEGHASGPVTSTTHQEHAQRMSVRANQPAGNMPDPNDTAPGEYASRIHNTLQGFNQFLRDAEQRAGSTLGSPNVAPPADAQAGNVLAWVDGEVQRLRARIEALVSRYSSQV